MRAFSSFGELAFGELASLTSGIVHVAVSFALVAGQADTAKAKALAAATIALKPALASTPKASEAGAGVLGVRPAIMANATARTPRSIALASVAVLAARQTQGVRAPAVSLGAIPALIASRTSRVAGAVALDLKGAFAATSAAQVAGHAAVGLTSTFVEALGRRLVLIHPGPFGQFARGELPGLALFTAPAGFGPLATELVGSLLVVQATMAKTVKTAQSRTATIAAVPGLAGRRTGSGAASVMLGARPALTFTAAQREGTAVHLALAAGASEGPPIERDPVRAAALALGLGLSAAPDHIIVRVTAPLGVVPRITETTSASLHRAAVLAAVAALRDTVAASAPARATLGTTWRMVAQPSRRDLVGVRLDARAALAELARATGSRNAAIALREALGATARASQRAAAAVGLRPSLVAADTVIAPRAATLVVVDRLAGRVSVTIRAAPFGARPAQAAAATAVKAGRTTIGLRAATAATRRDTDPRRATLTASAGVAGAVATAASRIAMVLAWLGRLAGVRFFDLRPGRRLRGRGSRASLTGGASGASLKGRGSRASITGRDE